MKLLKLYLDSFWFSPYSFAVFVALKEKGIAFDPIEVALHKKENKDLAYRKASVTGRIPAIQHGDFWLAESSAIIEYLEEAFGGLDYPSILPKSVEMRGKARMVLAWIRSSRDLMPLIQERSTATMFYERASSPLSQKGKESADKLIEVAGFLIPSGSENLFDGWSIADADLSFALHRLILNDHPVPDKVRRYAEHHWARASVQEFINRRRPPYVPYQ